MPDYKEMYHELFNAITNSVELLNKAQLATEEMYISSNQESEIRTHDSDQK